MEYDWYKVEVAQKYKTLKELYAKRPTKEIKYAMATIEDLLLYREPDYSKQSEAQIFYDEYQRFKRCKFLWNDLSTFSTYAQKPIDYDVKAIRCNLSNDDLFALTHDFFKHGTNKEIFKQFMTFYKQRKRNVHFLRKTSMPFYGESFYVPYFKDFYIQLKPRKEFGDAATLAHEYGHGIQFLNNYHPNFFYKNHIFQEIISTLFEFLLLLYYSQNGEYQYIAINSLIDVFEERKNQTQNINTFLNYIAYLGLENCYNKIEEAQRIEQYFTLYGNDAFHKMMKEGRISTDIMYIFATTIVCELLNVYYRDQDKAIYLAQKIMEIDPRLSPEDYYNEILKLGLYPNKTIPRLNHRLKKELSRYE